MLKAKDDRANAPLRFMSYGQRNAFLPLFY
jgi:hypothetical protein